uniref:MFS domain-containing protein n=1 Tax=Syphacia muris TaxID=451379 RepID=A0A0N5AND7_9BILA
MDEGFEKHRDLSFDESSQGRRTISIGDVNDSVENGRSYAEIKATNFPDGGYGWVIVIVAFYSNFVVDGICYAFANFRPVIQDNFKGSSEASIAFVGSSIIGTYLIVGMRPIASGLVNSFGPRKTVAIGGIISCLAFLASTVIGNIYMLIIIYGIVGGVGFGFIYLPSIVVVCFYFNEKRSLATGIAVAGSGVGSIVMPFIIGQLQDFGFIAICIVLAIFALSCTFVGMFYEPTNLEPEEKFEGMTLKLGIGNLDDDDFLPPSPLSPVIMQLREHNNRQRPKSYEFSISNDFIIFPEDEIYGDSLELSSLDTAVKGTKSVQVEEKRLTQILKDYVDLAKETTLLILLISNVFAMLGFYVPFVFPFDLAVSNGISSDDAKNLVSLIGFANTLGRLLFGWLSDKKWLSALTINNICLIFCGILTMLGPICNGYWLIFFFCVLFGVFGAAYICLTAVILSDWLGLDRLTNSFGILVIGRSVGCFFGTPIAGAIKDATNNISWSFYASGSLLLLGGVFSCLIPVLAKPKQASLGIS